MERHIVNVEPASLGGLVAKSLLELTVIVVGVLIALTADDWWADRNERFEEQELLIAMRDDVAATIELSERNLGNAGRIRDALRTLSAGSEGPAGTAEPTDLDHLMQLALWDLATTQVQMSAYAEARNSGYTRLIRDPELRRTLARFDHRLEALRTIEGDVYDHQQLKMDPYLLANSEVARFSPWVHAESLLLDGVSSLSEPLPTLDQLDHRVLLDDLIFRNHVAAKYYLISNLVEDASALHVILQELRTLIDARLAELER